MKKMNFLLFVILILSLPLASRLMGQEISPHQLEGKLGKYTSEVASQKVFLHTDRTDYRVGETIWFKAYLVNGVTHQPDLSGANLHVELWNVQGELIRSLVLQPEGGSASGDLKLGFDLPDGNYFIRAYTDWMLNAGEEFLFRHYFYLENPDYANRIENSSRRFNQDFNRQLERMQQDYQLGFFPEGGRLVNGVKCKVAVKLTDATGRGVQATGDVRDQNGVVVGGFETNGVGLGVFSVEPVAGNQYKAEIRIPGQRPFVTELPKVEPEGFAIHVELFDDETLQITAHYASMDGESGQCAILGHSRGQATFFLPEVSVRGSETFRLPLSDFPTGITHFTLFSASARPLAERLVFINNDDQAYFDVRALSLRSGDANALNIDVMASDRDGIPLEGDFSVSVQFGNVTERTYQDNIFSYLFLSSDLKGLVKDPALYFDYEQENIEEAVDLLMLTHGWRRFNWDEIISGREPVLAHTPVFGTILKGALYNPEDDQGVRNAEINMRLAEDRSQVFTTRTNERGIFTFENLPFPDSVLVEILPPMIAGRLVPRLEILESGQGKTPVPELAYEVNVLTQPQKVTARGRQWTRTRPERREQSGAGQASPYGRPDQTIYVDQNQPYGSVLDVLRDKAVGMTVSGSGNITVRGPSSIMNQGPPLFIIDGVESQGAFLGVHPRDVDRIEIFRGASTAAFGMRGAQGVIVAYTKRRDFESEQGGQNMFLVAGLHAPREFMIDFEMPVPRIGDNQVKTIFWEPELLTNEEGMGRLQFFPAGGVGQYRIVIQGISKDGKIGFGEFLIGN